jgi:hypothetical protein
MVVFTPSFTRLLVPYTVDGSMMVGVFSFGVVGPKTAILDGQNIFFIFWL